MQDPVMHIRHTHRSIVYSLLLSLVAGVSLLSSPVAACTALSCPPTRVFPAQGDLPADQVKLWVSITGGADAGTAAVRVSRLDGEVQTALDFEVRSEYFSTSSSPDMVLTPRAPLAVGTRLVLEVDAPSCLAGSPRLRAEYRVTEARPAPTTLGTVEVTPAGRDVFVAPASGICESAVDGSYVDVTVKLAPDAEPFKDVINQSLLVDGAPYFGVSVFNAGVVVPGVRRIFAICRGNVPFEQYFGATSLGSHRVRVRGTLVSGAVVESNEVEISLGCSGPIPAMPDRSIDAGSLSIVRDAGVGNVPDADSAGSASDGCSAARGIAGRNESPFGIACAMLVAALIGRRRRMLASPGTSVKPRWGTMSRLLDAARPGTKPRV